MSVAALIRAALLAVASSLLLAGCGIDGEPAPPSRAAQSGPAALF